MAADGDAYDLYYEEIAAAMGLLEQLNDNLALKREPEMVRAGAWRVYAPDHNSQGYPMCLVIVPDPEASDEEVYHGITRGVLQKIPITEMRAQYLEEIRPRIADANALGDFAGAARTGSRRRGKRYYALLARAYVSITDAGDQRPLRTLSEVSGIGIDTVRTQVREARKRGMLTGIPGRPGGRLTDKARELLTQMEPDEPYAPSADESPERPAAVQQPIVAAIVTSDRGVLVGRRNDRTPPWTFIAGEAEPGEPPEVTAIREVKEETTLPIRTGGVIGERVHPKTHRRMIYLAAWPAHGTDIYVGDEAELAEVRWVSLAEADELLPGMFEPVRTYLSRVLESGGASG
jgi:8-oxo-dGTP pyrophosphatase MutT (NUDIX family)